MRFVSHQQITNHIISLISTSRKRTLVAIDNAGSQGAFVRCGYKTDDVVCELLVANKSHQSREDFEIDKGSDVIQVNTINYSGLWIEGQRTRSRLDSALGYLTNSQYDLAGAVVPVNDTAIIQDALSLGFERIGRYQWWQRSLIDI